MQGNTLGLLKIGLTNLYNKESYKMWKTKLSSSDNIVI